MITHSLAVCGLPTSRPLRSLRRLGAMVLMASGLVACAQASPTPIWAYRLGDEHTLNVLTTGNPAWDTWVGAVEQTPTEVVVSVLTRPKGFGSGTLGGQDLWLSVRLDEPLGNRLVLDAIGNTPIDLRP